MAPSITGFKVESSVLFKQITDQLHQRMDVIIEGGGGQQARIKLQGPGIDHSQEITLDGPGTRTHFYLPAIETPVSCRAELQCNGDTLARDIELLPQKRWEIHLVHFSHTDTGYTDLPSRIARNHGQFLQEALEYCRQTDDYPEEARFRWTIETGYQFLNGWERLSIEEQGETIARIKEGRFDLTPLYLAHVTELYDPEVLLRTMHDMARFAKRYELKLRSAMNTDVSGQPWAIVQLLAQCGIPYLSMAVNSTRARAPKVPRPFYWEAQDGSRVLVWDTDPRNAYIEGATLGFVKNIEMVADRLPRYLDMPERRDAPYDVLGLRTAGEQADNARPVREISDIVKEWNAAWTFPRVILSTNSRFMVALEKSCGDRIPTYTQAWPDWWVDTFGTVARETATLRLAHEELNTGQIMATLAQLHDDSLEYPRDEVDTAYTNILLADEIDWCASESQADPDCRQSHGQFHEQAAFAYRGAIAAEATLIKGQANLAPLIKSSRQKVVVFNPLSWARTDIVRVDLPNALVDGKSPVIETDDGQVLACQLDSRGPQTSQFTFVAPDVPPLGYRSFKVAVEANPPENPEQLDVSDSRLENRFYRVTMAADGTIASIFDKEANRELVAPTAEHGFFQLIYEETVGGRKPVSLDQMADQTRREAADLQFMDYANAVFPERFPGRDTRFTRTGPTNIEQLAPTVGPVTAGLNTRSAAVNIPRLERSVHLHAGIKRIDLVAHMDKTEVRAAEGIYFAFPFQQPDFKVELENAYSFLTPEEGQLPGSCRDWYLVQKWVRLFNEQGGICWSPREAPLVQLGEIQSGRWLHELKIARPTIYSWLFNNYWWTNVPASQGGWNYRFGYAVGSYTGPPARSPALRLGWEYQTPLRGWFVDVEQDSGTMPNGRFSLCSVNEPNVIITALKPGPGTGEVLLRLFEVEGRETEVTLEWHGPQIKSACLADPMMEQRADLPSRPDRITLTIKPHSITTVGITHV